MKRGVSLAETVIALFVISMAAVILVGTLHVGLRHQSRTERRMMATQMARKKMAELKAWTRQFVGGSQTNFDQPASNWQTKGSGGDPDYPGLVATCVVADHQLFSPCTTLEAPYGGQARTMNSSSKKVKISVEDPGEPGWQVDLVTIIADPTRDMKLTEAVKLIMTSGVPLVMARDATVTMRAEAYYTDGRVIPDLFFDWYVVPLGGTGTVIPARDGRTATFRNSVTTQPPPAASVYTGGRSVVAVYGTYRGHGQAPQNWDPVTFNPYISISPIFLLGQ